MGRSYVPHQAQQGLHLSHPLLVDGGPPGSLGQVALCKLACKPQASQMLDHPSRRWRKQQEGKGITVVAPFWDLLVHLD